MPSDYFKETKEGLESRIPDYGTDGFQKMQDHIRKELSKEERSFDLLLRSFKIPMFDIQLPVQSTDQLAPAEKLIPKTVCCAFLHENTVHLLLHANAKSAFR